MPMVIEFNNLPRLVLEASYRKRTNTVKVNDVLAEMNDDEERIKECSLIVAENTSCLNCQVMSNLYNCGAGARNDFF